MRETPKAAQAFHEYCILGTERSLAKLATSNQEYAKSIPLLKKWSSEHDWQERVKEYDAARAEEKRIKRETEIEEMNKRHAMIATTQQSRAIKQIDALIAAEKFGSQAVVALLKLATDLEREARGANIKKVELTGKDGGPIETQARHQDLALLTDDELEEIEAKILRARERNGQA